MKDKIVVMTKVLIDVMFYMGILVTLTVPFSISFLGKYLEKFAEHYAPMVVIYFILGIIAVLLVRELRKMMGTVVAGECFVMKNVLSLQKMSVYSFLIVCVSFICTVVYITVAMLVVILVFSIAGLFSRILSMVFEQAITYKEENDLTI